MKMVLELTKRNEVGDDTAGEKKHFSCWSQIITLSLLLEAALYKRLQRLARRVSFQIKMEQFRQVLTQSLKKTN